MNVQPVTLYPVPPVKPIVYPRPHAPTEERRAEPQRALTQSHVGRTVDVRV